MIINGKVVSCSSCKWKHDLKVEENRKGTCPFKKICEKEPYIMYQEESEATE